MGKVFSLDSLREELDNKYAPVKVDVDGDVVVLRNLLRLPEKERNTAVELMTEVDKLSEGEETAETMTRTHEAVREVLRLVAADGKGDKLVSALGDDLALAMELVRVWGEATQPGEASSSPS